MTTKIVFYQSTWSGRPHSVLLRKLDISQSTQTPVYTLLVFVLHKRYLSASIISPRLVAYREWWLVCRVCGHNAGEEMPEVGRTWGCVGVFEPCEE